MLALWFDVYNSLALIKFEAMLRVNNEVYIHAADAHEWFDVKMTHLVSRLECILNIIHRTSNNKVEPRVTSPLWEATNGGQWIPLTKG